MSLFKYNIALLATLAIVLVSFTLQVNATTNSSAKIIVNKINTLRAKHHAPALVWDNKLYKYAQKWSNNCVFEHSQGPYGENLGLGYPSWVSVINDWYNEVKNYNYSNPGFSMDTGHFTSLVWKDTTKIGCGVKYCKNLYGGAKLYTCSFEQAPNVIGEFAENVLKP